MKLASYKDGSRDGQLVVVSRDLSLAHYATGIATRLQQVLDDWNYLAPLLQDLSETLNHGKARHAFAFEPQLCMAPLPRAFGRTLAGAWPAHRSLLAQADGHEPPADLNVNPLTRLVPGDWGWAPATTCCCPPVWTAPRWRRDWRRWWPTCLQAWRRTRRWKACVC
jgi:fumarylacetoacetate (FAA) hydrolase